MTQYGTFQLDTPNDEEKLRFVLSVLPLDVLHRLATMSRSIMAGGFGRVILRFDAGRLFTITPAPEEKV